MLLFGSFESCTTSSHASYTTSGLHRFVLVGQELHGSLTYKQLAGANHGVPSGVRSNPHFSVEPAVVASIARYASQGQPGGGGIRAALCALYRGGGELGFYGLEATSSDEAVRLEALLRDIWSHNVALDRARLHRESRVLLVVWHDGVSPACWQSVNEALAERLSVSGPAGAAAGG